MTDCNSVHNSSNLLAASKYNEKMKKYGDIDDIGNHYDGFGCDDGERNIVKVIPLNGTNQYIALNGKEFWLHGDCLGKIIYMKEYNKGLELK